MEQVFSRPSDNLSPASPQNKKQSRRLLYIIAFILVVLVLGLVGSRFLGSNSSESDISPTPTEYVEPTEEPSPTPEEEDEEEDDDITPTTKPTITSTPGPTKNPVDKTTGLDRSTLTVSVQNGSGVGGAAKKVGDLLTSLGYKVSSVGNADNDSYENTVIEVSSTDKAFLNLLKSDLSGSYTIGTTSATFSGSTDARVIVGKK